MFSIRTNRPPEYRQPGHSQGETALKDNFARFFEWGLGLKNPIRQIPEIGERLGFGARVHPLGFVVVYLSEKGRGEMTPEICGVVRANLYPYGVVLNDDIHSHGFDFYSGVIQGELTNTRYFPDWSQRAPDGEGYIGYEGRVDTQGNNRTVRCTDATILISEPEVHGLERGQTYTMSPKDSFHAVDVEADIQTATIFCKTPNFWGHEGISLTLRRATEPPVPSEY